jgi:hypothetical protein
MPPKSTRGVLEDAIATDKQYDDGGTTRSFREMDQEKTVVFWSEPLALKVILYKTYDVLGVPKKEMLPVQFMDRKFETDDEVIINGLRKHGSFGGSFAKKFADHAVNGGQPMLWEGSLPLPVLTKIQEREATFTTEEFSYEPDKPDSQRYSDSE